MEAHSKRLKQYESLLGSDEVDMKELRKACFCGCPDEKGLRAMSWKLLLYYLPTKRSEWETTLKQQRDTYQSFIEEMIIKPGSEQHGDTVSDHPLNPNPTSQWCAYFKDNEMLLQIDKDCRRLYPDLVFFQKATDYPCRRLTESVNGLENLRKRVENTFLESHTVSQNRLGMTQMASTKKRTISNNHEYHTLGDGKEAHWEVVERMLFIFAKLNPGIKYVQGMNELLGPIYYTMATDPSESWREHAEADSFFCFTNLMAEIRDNFIKSLDNSHCGIGGNMNALMSSLYSFEPQVYQLLLDQNLKPEFFAFRWLTLLLSQEFKLPDVVRIWDSLFADEFRFKFLVDVCCAMIILVKKDILKNDFASNMKLLQRYPESMSIETIIQKASQLRKKS